MMKIAKRIIKAVGQIEITVLLITSFIFFIICINLILFSKDEIYSIKECKDFNVGDTIFVKEFYSIEKKVVLKNYPEKEIIEMRDLKNEWETCILEYDSFRFK